MITFPDDSGDLTPEEEKQLEDFGRMLEGLVGPSNKVGEAVRRCLDHAQPDGPDAPVIVDVPHLDTPKYGSVA